MHKNPLVEELHRELEEQQKQLRQQKLNQMFSLKKQRISELRAQKKKSSDGAVHHKQAFKHASSVPKLFNKESPLIPQPVKQIEAAQMQAWLPTDSQSRLLSPCRPTTEPNPRPKTPKEKLWRPFSSQPAKMGLTQVLPPSAKETSLSSQKNILVRDAGEKWEGMRPFYPVRAICSAFPTLK